MSQPWIPQTAKKKKKKKKEHKKQQSGEGAARAAARLVKSSMCQVFWFLFFKKKISRWDLSSSLFGIRLTYLFNLTAKLFIGEKVLLWINVYAREESSSPGLHIFSAVRSLLTLGWYSGGGHTWRGMDKHQHLHFAQAGMIFYEPLHAGQCCRHVVQRAWRSPVPHSPPSRCLLTISIWPVC